MNNITSIFAVIDPTTDNQYALQRAIRLARVTNAKIHAYLCLSPTLDSHDPAALERVERARYEPWLENIVEQSRAEGCEVSSELDWNNNWRNALGAAARRVKSDFIVKASRRRTTKERLLVTSSDLALLQVASCPVQLVSSEVVDDLYRVLIAIDAKRNDEKYQAIFDSVVDYGRTIASTNEKGELHAVYAYSGSEDFAHVTDIAKRVGTDTEHVHVQGGDPEKAIAEVATEIGAQIIVIGLSTSTTLANRIFGNLVDRLLNNVKHDILIVIPHEE